MHSEFIQKYILNTNITNLLMDVDEAADVHNMFYPQNIQLLQSIIKTHAYFGNVKNGDFVVIFVISIYFLIETRK